MIKPMLWIVASIFFVLSLALFIFLLWEKFPPIQAGSLALGDLVNLLTALLTMVGLAIALGSFYVAIVAYQKSVKDSEEQQKSLDASREQLQAVVETAKKQQEVLTQNLKTSKALLALQEDQWKREQERLARKPVIEMHLETIKGFMNLDELQVLKEIEFPLQRNTKWARLNFAAFNKGNEAVAKPIMRIHVEPQTVFVDPADFQINERTDHNSYQFSGNQILDIEPIEVSKGPSVFSVAITVPDSIDTFDLVVWIYGKNLPRKESRLHFKVTRSTG